MPGLFTNQSSPKSHLSLCLRLVGWFLFRPSSWRAYVSEIDAALPVGFCLSELSIRQWRCPKPRRLLLDGYVISPLAVGILAGGVLWLLGSVGSGFIFGVLLGTLMGVVTALVASVVAGVVVGIVASASFGLILGHEGALVIDVVVGNGFGLVFGLSAGAAGFISTRVTADNSRFSRSRRIGGVITGLFISAVVMALAVGATSGVAVGWQNGFLTSTAVGVIVGSIPMLVIGLSVGWRTRNWQRGAFYGIGSGLVMAVLSGVLLYGAGFEADIGGTQLLYLVSLVVTAVFILLFALPFVAARQIAGDWAGAIAGVASSQIVHFAFAFVFPLYSLESNLRLSLICTLLALTYGWWRPLLFYPLQLAWHTVLYRLSEQSLGNEKKWIRRHAVFWDEYQWLPLIGLVDHIVLEAERDPDEGQAILDYLSATPQSWAAREAQIELDARRLEQYRDVSAIGGAHYLIGAGELEGPASALLRSFHRVSQDVEAALYQGSNYHQRLALSTVSEQLNGLIRELTRSHERYAARFRPIAGQWQRIVADHVQHLADVVERRREIDNPYIIGVPLTAQQEIFVGRRDVSGRIERLLFDRRQPPLLLYGQRRMGKTSLLNNLGRLLPHTIIPLLVDLQGPVSVASNHAGLLYNVARSLRKSAVQQRAAQLPELSRPALEDDPFTAFDEWLDEVEATLQVQNGHTILLLLDEFEALDYAFLKDSFDEAFVLGMLRHLIQHRLHFKVLLAGSHTLDEFQRWSGYLINTEVLPLGYLQEDEARQLIEEPVKDFALRYRPEATRRVYELTGGHPFLLQLLCSEIVSLKNEQAPQLRRLATVADVEAAVAAALLRGSMFFADIEHNQLDSTTLNIIRSLAQLGEAVLIDNETLQDSGLAPDLIGPAIDRLLLRELLQPVHNGYRFRIEMIRRWFTGLNQ